VCVCGVFVSVCVWCVRVCVCACVRTTVCVCEFESTSVSECVIDQGILKGEVSQYH
jgi:hypothetical protein